MIRTVDKPTKSLPESFSRAQREGQIVDLGVLDQLNEAIWKTLQKVQRSRETLISDIDRLLWHGTPEDTQPN